MNKKRLTYVLLIFSILTTLFSCKQAKYVEDGEYLYKIKEKSLPWNEYKKTIHFVTYDLDSTSNYSGSDDLVYVGDLYGIIKPQPNKKIRLLFFNAIDSVRMNRQMNRKKSKIDSKNENRQSKENSINKERNNAAKEKGKDSFYQKKVRKKRIKTGWRFWVVNKISEPPVVSDSSKVIKSNEQLTIYLKKKGFYDSYVTDTTIYHEKSKKSFTRYTVYTGQPYLIGEIKFDSLAKNVGIDNQYRRMEKKVGTYLNSGDLFDADVLDSEREKFSKFCRDNAYYGFNKNYLFFVVDTTKIDHVANIYISVKPKMLEDPSNPDEFKEFSHLPYKVNAVTFYIHNKDSLTFKDFSKYKKRLKDLGKDYSQNNFPLLDTLVYIDTLYYRDLNFKKQRSFFGKIEDSLIVFRGTYIYNEELIIDPYLLDKQNFLEIINEDNPGWYKEYYIERSFRRILGLEVFESITPSVIIDPIQPYKNFVQVTYHLTPGKKQLFSIEPRATNSNGFLGLSASINYTNKNLFGGAEKLKLSFSGGLESQPAVFNETDEGGDISTPRLLNTFELSPKISLEFPKLVPLPKGLQKTLSKRLYPTTIFDLSYNFQKRSDFDRSISEFAYSWKFNEDKSKIHQIKWQSFNFVKLDKTAFFEQQLAVQNDPFLLNSYSDHFSNKFQYIFTFNNQRVQRENDKQSYLFSTTTFTGSGVLLDQTGIGKNSLSVDNLKQVLGVPFTEFLELDNDLRYYLDMGRTRSMAFRLLSGLGYAFGNSLSLPYEQSFYAGGSNDMRAWEARTIAPGGIQTWNDTTSTTTQIGDVRLELNIEYRFQFSSVLKAAWFIDAGNIWKLQDDPSTLDDDLGVFNASSFYKQTAIGGGFGLRLDFDFFIMRMDLAFPLHNPYMFNGERWIWQERPQYTEEVSALPSWYSANLRGPFKPRLNIGIGYPF
jgi:hypothetical protein